jgi:hypothetical protein
MPQPRFGPLIFCVIVGAGGGFMIGGTLFERSLARNGAYLIMASVLTGAILGIIGAAILEWLNRDSE